MSEDVIYETTAGSYDTTEGKVFTVSGGDWDQVAGAS